MIVTMSKYKLRCLIISVRLLPLFCAMFTFAHLSLVEVTFFLAFSFFTHIYTLVSSYEENIIAIEALYPTLTSHDRKLFLILQLQPNVCK